MSEPEQAVMETKSEEVGSTEVVKVRRKRRPARVQVDPSTVTEEDRPPQIGTVFNIWYLKWSGGDRDDALNQRHADGRCNISRDSGYTKADKVPGSYFCLYFARGLCTKGKNCEYLHRLPTVTDIYPPNVDCFGRDRFSDYRDDMGGVGSFLRQNRTLYIGRIIVGGDVEEVVSKHFSEWGDIERTRVLHNRNVAFVTYSNEANAQFAKEAMAHQSLDGEEVLNVRWAIEDPNPLSKVREKRRLEEQAAEAIKRLLPKEYVDEIEGKDPEAHKRRKEMSSFNLEGYEAPDEIWYAQGENSVNPTLQLEADDNDDRDDEESIEQKLLAYDEEPKRPSLLSASALSNLKALGTTRPATNALAALSAYDSEDD